MKKERSVASKYVSDLGSASDPTGGAQDAPPELLVCWEGDTPNYAPLSPWFVQTFKCFFQDLERPNSRVSTAQKSFFPGLSWKRSIQNIDCTRSKSAYTKSVISVSALK